MTVNKRPSDDRFVAVLGLHSSGSSCLAGVLYHLGLYLGNHLIGHYGNDPDNNKCGFESARLSHICETAIPFLATNCHLSSEECWSHLDGWIKETKTEALNRETIPAGKYPQLCRLGPQLIGICGRNLRVIVSERAIEESIESLKRRCHGSHPQRIEQHQRWLQAGKAWILNQLEESQLLVVKYESLLRAPGSEVERIARFLNLHPTETQLSNVARWVDPNKRHICR